MILFAVMIGSHVIPSFALVISQAIYAVSGVVSAAMTADELSEQNLRLAAEVESERRRTAALTADRAALQSDIDIAQSRIEVLDGERGSLRAQNQRLQDQIDDQRLSSARDNQRLQADLSSERDRLELAEAQLAAVRGENQTLAEILDEGDHFVTLRGVRMTRTRAVMETMSGVGQRTRLSATANVASLAGESIPFYGIAIIVGATTYELNVACQNMSAIYDLTVALEPNSAIPDDRDSVCGMQVPTSSELWDLILTSPQSAWSTAANALQIGGDWLSGIEAPSFDGSWDRLVSWWDWIAN